MKVLLILLACGLVGIHGGCKQKDEAAPHADRPKSETTSATTSAAVHEERPKSEVPAKKSVIFNGAEYIHRWSENGQNEFTPAGQEDLDKWTDMLTINVYPDAVEGDGLALVANKVLGTYQEHGGKVLRTNPVRHDYRV